MHLLNTEYEKYLSDTLFCNDRSFSAVNSGTGAGTSATNYRWAYSPWDSIESRHYPKLLCSQKNDQLLLETIIHSIALITADEITLAGGYNTGNLNYYLYTGYQYWTMTAGYYNVERNTASIRGINEIGQISGLFVYNTMGVRPVINVKANTFQNGDGTALNPFQ